MNKLLLCAIFILAGFVSRAQSRNILFDHLSIRDGLSQNSIIRVFQDRQDLIWIATRNGLNRYDGSTIDIHRSSKENDRSLSSSDVTSIAEDCDGMLWVGTHNGLNRLNPQTREVTRYFSSPTPGSLSHNVIKHLYYDSHQMLWVGTLSGLDIYDTKKQQFKRIFSGGSLIWMRELSNNRFCFTEGKHLYIYDYAQQRHLRYAYPFADEIYSFFQDNMGTLWIGSTASGLKRFDPIKGRFEPVELKMKNGRSFNNEQIGYMVQDDRSNLLIATRNGLIVYNPLTRQCTDHYERTGTKNGICDNAVITLYKDRAGGIWIGTYSGGLNYFSKYSTYFSLHTPHRDAEHPIYNFNAAVESKGRIWWGTDCDLLSYAPETNQYAYYLTGGEKHADKNEIKFVHSTPSGKLLLSAYGKGLLEFDPTQGSTVSQTTNFRTFIKATAKDPKGNLWIAQHTNEYFGYWDVKKQQFYNGLEIAGETERLRIINSMDVILDNDGSVWIATRNQGLYHYDPQKRQIKQYLSNPNDSTSLPIDNVCTLFRSHDNRIWIGTYGGGLALYNREQDYFESFGLKNGLPSLVINGIEQDRKGDIWITTEMGVSHFNLPNRRFVNYTHSNGFPLNETSLHAFLKAADGTFYIGGNNGFVSFVPEMLEKNPRQPKMIISGFRIWSKSEDETAEEWMPNPQKEIRLKYNQSTFTINYASLNYVYPHQNQYAYMVEGLDDNWNYVGAERSATFANLPAGNYLFKVKGTNNDGVWCEQEASLRIVITPPFWASWWAYVIYFLMIALLIIFVMNYFLTKEQLENDIKIKQIEKQTMEEVHQTQLRLFTNFSHELRTPLTLIIGPLKGVLNQLDKKSTIFQPLALMQKNANRLLLLINQLMDLRKLEAGSLNLEASNELFCPFVEGIAEAFQPVAKTKNIKYSLEYVVDDMDLWFDPMKLEKVLFNLLSNAFRHTRVGGEIAIVVRSWSRAEAIEKYGKRFNQLPDCTSKMVEIKVHDNGEGIEKEELSKIFDPFYQAYNYEQGTTYGTGIGLNLTKGIVELHKGIVWAESKVGEGAIFRVFLPLGDKHLADHQKRARIEEMNDDKYLIKPDILSNIDNDADSNREPQSSVRIATILLVEDNPDVRAYIRMVLKSKFTVREATNGLEGLEQARKIIPDLIITDIIMPGINGNEMCKRLKIDDQTNHIPIIMLTACTTTEEIKRGLSEGADDYVTKPFDAEQLLSRAEAMIENRERLRKAFSRGGIFIKKIGEETSTEEKFMNKVYTYIREHIDDSDLSIELFAKEIGMGRVQFYRKIKAIASCSPTRMILNIRMREASELLKQKNLSVSEVCYQVGFNDPSYFGKCFKIYFGVVPSEYKGEKMLDITD